MNGIYEVMRGEISRCCPLFGHSKCFKYNMFPFQFYKDNGCVLYGKDKKVLGENLDIVTCFRDIFGVVKDNAYAFFKSDGTLIADAVENFKIFESGWFVLLKNGVENLYRPDGSCAHRGASDYQMPLDGELFLARIGEDFSKLFENNDENLLTRTEESHWALFDVDGTLIVDNILSFSLKSSDFFALRFGDGREIVFDKKQNSKFLVPKNAKIELLDGGKFVVEQNHRSVLYRSNGVKLLEGKHTYLGFKSGMVLVDMLTRDSCLYDDNMNLVLQVPELCFGDEVGFIFRADGEYVFDCNAKLVATYPTGCVLACGNGYYLAWNEEQNQVSLHRPDDSCVAKVLVEAVVFNNDWKLLFRSSDNDDEENSVRYVLLDDGDNVVVQSADHIYYIEDFGAYIVGRNDKFSLICANGETVVCDADYIHVFGDLYVVERTGQKSEAYFLTNLEA